MPIIDSRGAREICKSMVLRKHYSYYQIYHTKIGDWSSNKLSHSVVRYRFNVNKYYFVRDSSKHTKQQQMMLIRRYYKVILLFFISWKISVCAVRGGGSSVKWRKLGSIRDV